MLYTICYNLILLILLLDKQSTIKQVVQYSTIVLQGSRKIKSRFCKSIYIVKFYDNIIN